MMTKPAHLLSVTLVAAAWLLLVHSSLEIQAVGDALSKRHNIMDPIYAFDDVDVQQAPRRTESDISRQQQQQQQAPVVTRKPPTANQTNQRRSVNATSAAPSDLLDEDDRPSHLRPSSSTTTTKRPLVSQTDGLIKLNPELDARLNSSLQSKIGGAFDPDIIAAPKKQPPTVGSTQQPGHWSALLDYYQKVRQQQSAIRQQAPVSPYAQIPVHLDVQERDDSLSTYRFGRPSSIPLRYSPGSGNAYDFETKSYQPPAQQFPVAVPEFGPYASGVSRVVQPAGTKSILLQPSDGQGKQSYELKRLGELSGLVLENAYTKAKLEHEQVCTFYEYQMRQLVQALADNGCGRSALAKSA